MIARRQIVLFGIIVTALLALLAWSYGEMTAAQRAARSGADDTAACRALAGRIAAVGSAPAVATRDLPNPEAAARVAGAARRADIPDAAIGRIDPEPARRVGDTSYTEKPIHVSLRRLTLRQVVTFIHTLAGDPAGLQVHELRLSTPRGEEAGNLWSAEVVCTSLAFAPLSAEER